MANLVDPLWGVVPPWAWVLLLILEVLVETAVAFYVADVISGFVHLHLDYTESGNDELKLVTFKTAEEAKDFIANDARYKSAKPYDQFLWKFHMHHDVSYPAFDTIFDQIMQAVKPGAAPYVVSIVLWAVGLMPSWFARMWIVGITLAFTSQFTHFAAHARNRGLIKNKFVLFLQDWHIIINPKVHKVHHEQFDCDFCVFNGWANPLLNCIRKLGTRVGYWPTHAPTVTVRAERVEKGLGTGGVAKVGGDDGTPPKAGAKAKSKTSRKYGQLDGEPAGNSLTAPLEPQSDEPYPIAAATESIEVTVQN